MESFKSEILINYDQKLNLFNDFSNAIEKLIESLLRNKLNPHLVTKRVKGRKSIEDKIVVKNYKYKTINDITDIVGLRIITYFEDEVDLVADVINNEFDIDKENSVDKRKREFNETDKFGYRSLHYIVSLNTNRLSLSEYKDFKGLKAEIQIRSILQHSWAEIEHDLGYKNGSINLPSIKRTFNRAAALLEQVDIEFVKLKLEIQNHEETVSIGIEESPDLIAIDLVSLKSYVKQNEGIVKKVEKELHDEGIVDGISGDAGMIEITLLPEINKTTIGTIKELDDLYKKNIVLIKDLAKIKIDGFKLAYGNYGAHLSEGSTISWLFEYLLDDNNNINLKS